MLNNSDMIYVSKFSFAYLEAKLPNVWTAIFQALQYIMCSIM